MSDHQTTMTPPSPDSWKPSSNRRSAHPGLSSPPPPGPCSRHHPNLTQRALLAATDGISALFRVQERLGCDRRGGEGEERQGARRHGWLQGRYEERTATDR